MRKALLLALAATAGLLLAVTPMIAHHSFAAEFDGNTKPIDMTGRVANDGMVANWGLETGPPNVLYRRGWRRDTLKPGEVITVPGFVAKDGSHTLAARQVQTPDGRRLFAGSPDSGPKQ